jgi:hypothetical protein
MVLLTFSCKTYLYAATKPMPNELRWAAYYATICSEYITNASFCEIDCDVRDRWRLACLATPRMHVFVDWHDDVGLWLLPNQLATAIHQLFSPEWRRMHAVVICFVCLFVCLVSFFCFFSILFYLFFFIKFFSFMLVNVRLMRVRNNCATTTRS